MARSMRSPGERVRQRLAPGKEIELDVGSIGFHPFPTTYLLWSFPEAAIRCPVRLCDLFQADSQHCSCDSIQTLLVPFYMDGPLGMHDRLARTESLRCGQ